MENQETPKHTGFSDAEIVEKPKHYLEPGTPSEIPQPLQDDLWRLYDFLQYLKKNPHIEPSQEELREYNPLAFKVMPFALAGGIYIPKDLPRGAQLKTYAQWMREGYVFQDGLPLRPYEADLDRPLKKQRVMERLKEGELRTCPTCGRPL